MMNLFTEPAERAKATGVFGFAAAAVVMLLPGFGAGMALNSVLLAAMSDVAPKQSGFASGLVNTASRGARLETAADSHLDALTGGCHLAFLTGAPVAATAATMAGLLLRTRNTAARGDTGSSALATAEGN
jgi:hypothetical protein